MYLLLIILKQLDSVLSTYWLLISFQTSYNLKYILKNYNTNPLNWQDSFRNSEKFIHSDTIKETYLPKGIDKEA